MVANGVRKEFSLKTYDYEDAVQKAADLDAVWEAPTHEVAIAQINAIKGFSKQAQNLPFDEVWRRYEVHPERAMPHTVAEQMSCRNTFNEFVRFATAPAKDRKQRRTIVSGIGEVPPSGM